MEIGQTFIITILDVFAQLYFDPVSTLIKFPTDMATHTILTGKGTNEGFSSPHKTRIISYPKPFL